MTDHSIKITAKGPLADAGTLPLAEMARLLGEFQQTLERIALQLHGFEGGIGRRPTEVTAAVRLEFAGIRRGSAELLIRRDEDLLTNDALDETLRLLERGVGAIRQGGQGLPKEFDTTVLNGLLKFSGGLAPGQINTVTIEVDGRSIAQMDTNFREKTRHLTRQRTARETTLVGLLSMTDFAPSSLKCRIDTLHESVLCDFDTTLRSDVLENVDTLVEARGIGEFASAGDRLISLDLLSVSPVALADVPDIAELAEVQGVQPWAARSEVESPFEDLSDMQFDDFLKAALSSRLGQEDSGLD